jgi:hypothetical protein
MNKENHFSRKFKNKSNQELQLVIDTPEDYQKEAVQAAIWELEKRGEKSEKAIEFENKADKKKLDKEQSVLNQLGIYVPTVKPSTRILHFLLDGFIIQAFIYAIDMIPFLEIANFLGLLLYPMYYIFFEYHYQWTPGKLVTNTIVVDKDGNRPDLRTIILRTVGRYIPFEPFSCLGENSWGWHDRWTNTYVIEKKDLSTLRSKKNLPPVNLSPLKFSKTSYILLTVGVLIIVLSSITAHRMNSELSEEGIIYIEALDEKDKKVLKGNWVTGDPNLIQLNFVSKESIIGTHSDSSLVKLNFKLEHRILRIFNEEVSKEYMIVESSTNQIQLLEVNFPMNTIYWTKK